MIRRPKLEGTAAPATGDGERRRSRAKLSAEAQYDLGARNVDPLDIRESCTGEMSSSQYGLTS